MFDGVVTSTLSVLRICVGVLRDVTVLLADGWRLLMDRGHCALTRGPRRITVRKAGRPTVSPQIPRGDRVSQRSVGRAVLERAWLPFVAVVAVGLGAVGMWKVHEA